LNLEVIKSILVEPKIQKQHIVPQVYLREFGFRRGDQWFISVCKKGDSLKCDKSIESFLRKVNHYDIPVTDINFRRVNESLINHAFESKYPRLLKELKTERLTNDLLIEIIEVALNMLCRTDHLRNSVNDVLLSDENESMVNLITMFLQEDKKNLIRNKIQSFPREHHLNALKVFLLDHILEIIKRNKFTVSVIKAPISKYWITSDNPAMLIDAPSDLIFDFNTEIIFPFSKEYLIYIYNPRKVNKFLQLSNPEIITVAQLCDVTKIINYLKNYNNDWVIIS